MSFVNFTNLRYVQEKGRNLNVTFEEMKIFFGINLLMSVLRYPRLRMYWQKFTQVSTVTSKMSRDRFTQIRTNLKIVNDLDVSQDQRKADRLWKVRPFLTAIRDGCLKMIRPVRVCIDEQMIPFTGTVTNLKQFLRGKPNPEGMKNFVLATPGGLVLDFCVYQGKGTTFQTDCHLTLNVAEAVVMKLSESVPASSCIYMDRYFTTEKLIDLLGEQQIACTGTVMRNKLPKCDFICDKDFSRLPRGTTEMFVSQDLEKVSVAVVEWNDNKPIYLMSSKEGKTPMDECRRWCKKQKKYIDVSRPNIVTSYNQYMGGVDMNDRLISYYRNFYKTKKWTLIIIMHFFTLAVVNAWVQYRNDRKILGRPKKEISDLMDFMMEISEHLTESGDKDSSSEEELEEEQGPPPQKRKRLPPLPARLKKAGHMPEALEMKNPARCRRPGCSTGKSRIKCRRCDVFLCLTKDKNCYELFHQ
ncbi:piggyBac transposable element-derived protein 1-like [Nilaparvata lugens]|uniref:piggyBac transposable element-derived protein 1-like n=1 Tax=Nilaparvata lugens TaxID=108931 RepID=UPI00193E4702|nr:piggyBac transposable element-derived protein 1-like [Nilaparvata lugens]